MITGLLCSFDRSVSFVRDAVADLSDEEMVLQPPSVPNHAAWTLGHVIYSCQAIVARRWQANVAWIPGCPIGRPSVAVFL